MANIRHSGFFFPSFRGFFFRHSGFFFCHSGESRNPSFSCGLGIAKEREARALFTGFRLSPE